MPAASPWIVRKAMSQNIVGERLLLPGLVSEINRCFYYQDGEHPSKISAANIAKRAGFEANPIAEEGIRTWLSELPSPLYVNTLDLFYWEHRLGVWQGTASTLREGITHQIPPMNCRRFLELGLSTNVECRKEPFLLIRRMIELAVPELLDFQFNHDWVDTLHDIRRNKIPLPWRVKIALGWV